MKYYLIGIKGSGMSTLANLLYDLGNEVVGYDDSVGYKFTMEGLEKRGIKIYHGNVYPTLPAGTIVTYTAAINTDHHEVRRVRGLGYKIVAYKDLMSQITRKFETICVCGTHGKTTTSLMISDILSKSIGCSQFVGDGSGFGNRKSNLLVMESCEYNKHFLSYFPYNTIITNIELDHTETYPTIEDMIEAFQIFVNRTRNQVILCGDDTNSLKLNVNNPLYYGFNDNNDLIAKNMVVENNKTKFDVYYHEEFFDHYEVNMFGKHLILDSLAAIMTSIIYDIDKKIIKETLENFVFAKRRFNETVINSNVIIDDYAHHPTEIRVTYDSAKSKYPDKKIMAVFMPNTYSRTESLFDDFVKSLSLYDKAYITEIKCDRERKEDYPNISSSKLIEHIPNAEMISLDDISKLKDLENTVICFMSCANISPLVEKTKELLNNSHQ